MKILKKKKKKKIFFFFFLRLGICFSNREKSHLNPIRKGAKFWPLRTPKKIPGVVFSYKRKHVHEVLVNRLFKLAQEKV